MSPVMLIAAAIALFGLGLIGGFLFAAWRNKGEASKAGEIQEELDDYRRQVTEHFSETAEHFQAIGQQYRSLYKHMANGAGALCDPAHSDALLDFAGNQTPAIEEQVIDEPIAPPDDIKDYAVSDDIETAEVELQEDTKTTEESAASPEKPEPAELRTKSEDTETVEKPAAASEKTSDKPPAEEVLKEKVSAAIPVEPDRTVH